jgi:hypothetical protein
MNQAVTFLSDGGDTVRDLQMYLNPQAEHLLDWFHISMRLTVMSQLAKTVEAHDQPNLSAICGKRLERGRFTWPLAGSPSGVCTPIMSRCGDGSSGMRPHCTGAYVAT